MPNEIRWRAFEHSHSEKTNDWFWAFGIVAVSSAIVALLFGNVLFALLIIVAAFTMSLLSNRPAPEREFALTPRGVRIDNRLFPYQTLVSFWVSETSEGSILLIDAQHFLVPHIIVPLENTDPEAVHAYLLEYLPEVEMQEPFAQRILEMFGF